MIWLEISVKPGLCVLLYSNYWSMIGCLLLSCGRSNLSHWLSVDFMGIIQRNNKSLPECHVVGMIEAIKKSLKWWTVGVKTALGSLQGLGLSTEQKQIFFEGMRETHRSTGHLISIYINNEFLNHTYLLDLLP